MADRQKQAWHRIRGIFPGDVLTPPPPRLDGQSVLRIGIERGMAATLTVIAPLLVLLALPGYMGDHENAPVVLVAIAWCLAGCMAAALPLTLAQPEVRGWVWMWVAVACFVGLAVLEPFTLQRPLPEGASPWLLALSYAGTSCVAVAAINPIRAALLCAGIDAAVSVIYMGELPASHTILNAAGLALSSAVCIVTIRLRRFQVDRVDTAERHAKRRHENEHLEAALEAERVRTDALIHDSVLATLLAAGQQSPGTAAVMARTALNVVTQTSPHLHARPPQISLSKAFADAEPSLLWPQHAVHPDLSQIHGIDLPTDVADAFVAATLQAVSNSLKHAGHNVRRTVTATRTSFDGIRITIADTGAGFDMQKVGHERLGVRVSIVERIEQVGGTVIVLTSPGKGTVIHLDWTPMNEAPLKKLASFGLSMKLIPRRQLYRLLGVFIIVAGLTAIAEAVLITRAPGPIIAATLGLIIFPALTRGAKTGTMRRRTAWIIAAVGCMLCCTATTGLDPTTVDAGSIYWYPCGILAGAVMVWMAGHKAPPLIAVGFLAAQMTLWAGPTGTIRLGLAAEIVLVAAGFLMYRAISRVTAAADVAAQRHRELTALRSEQNAFHLERQRRLEHARITAAPMLHHILDSGGSLDENARAECRVLEQALRDEIRGRRLLNDAIRKVVTAHRRRGAHVQVLDDGGLDDMPLDLLEPLLDDVARRLAPLHASRIVIRTGQPDSNTAVTLVATTPDETAAALGLDSDEDDIELWENIARPMISPLAA
ncbi:ATP-binding protein [Frondihabitans sp. VKM Ac-2883]|uniref:sensor histidine kinase n=1 Tax=Frondihabitans sp. VKM Ac-2883 TaxID=2783823 RepID=UPI00188A703C|nr:hypothetical protein [Frondihabitans sp. VKM Ac-2883]